MIRRLIQISNSTRVVSLPAPWLKKNKISKGSDLEVDELDNRIIVSYKKARNEKEATLDLSDFDGELFWTQIDSAYIAGYDVISITTKDQKQNERLEKAVLYFPGMIIYEQRKNRVVFKAIAEAHQEDLGKIISRIFNMNIAMIEDSIDASQKSDWTTLSGMKKRDYTINSYVSYCFRQLNKFGYEPMHKVGILHTYIKILEMLADKLSEFFVAMGENKIKAEAPRLDLLLSLYKDMFSLHFSYTHKKLLEFEKKRNLLASGKSRSEIAGTFFKECSDLFFEMVELESELNA